MMALTWITKIIILIELKMEKKSKLIVISLGLIPVKASVI